MRHWRTDYVALAIVWLASIAGCEDCARSYQLPEDIPPLPKEGPAYNVIVTVGPHTAERKMFARYHEPDGGWRTVAGDEEWWSIEKPCTDSGGFITLRPIETNLPITIKRKEVTIESVPCGVAPASEEDAAKRELHRDWVGPYEPPV